MDEARLPQAFSYTIRHLLLAVTTNGFAFALIHGPSAPPVVVLAACVPIFWGGMAMTFIGHLLAHAEYPVGWLSRWLTFSGSGIAVSACMSAGIALILTIVWFVAPWL